MTTGWLLSDLKSIPKNGFRVFSTFACGGGSSMGYKRAGYDVIGANDIDPQMRIHYEMNLNPSLYYLSPVRDLIDGDVDDRLFDLDILDGSPPCSTFSTAGNRERDWGKKKKFREGQAEQVLSDLFFDFIDLVEKLKPKTIVAENVKGLISGRAKGYVALIIKKLISIGYVPQVFLLNAADCGVPQTRQRVFICARRKDLDFKPLELKPSHRWISCQEAISDLSITDSEKQQVAIPETGETLAVWQRTYPGDKLSGAVEKRIGKNSWFTWVKLKGSRPAPTLTSVDVYFHWNEPRRFVVSELLRFHSFPDDYRFDPVDGHHARHHPCRYLTGMSVPPKMMEFVAASIRDQWLQS